MNKELLIQTINWLEAGAPERRFDMGKMVEYDDHENIPDNWCGTTCCIAGYVWQQQKTPLDIVGNFYSFWDEIEAQAAEMLGLDYGTAHKLFYPATTGGPYQNFPGSWDSITPKQAAQAVRNVMTRGASYWEEILDFNDEDDL